MEYITLDGRDVPVQMSADTLRVYRKTFNRDLLRDMMSMKEELDMEVIENLFYISAAACDPDIPPIDEWLHGFSTFALYKGANQLLKVWRDQNHTTTIRKKKEDQ